MASLELLVGIIELCALLPPQLSPVLHQHSPFCRCRKDSEPDSLLLLRHVLDHRLDAVLLLELADKARIPATSQVTFPPITIPPFLTNRLVMMSQDSPEFACDPKILAAPHKGVGLARLGGRGDTRGVKVLLFSSGNGDESEESARRWNDAIAGYESLSSHSPTETHQSPFARDDPRTDVGLSSRRQTPSTGPERGVECSAVLDFGEVQQAVYVALTRTKTNVILSSGIISGISSAHQASLRHPPDPAA
jgi:hypothetical protein